jgi:hypothetical protein
MPLPSIILLWCLRRYATLCLQYVRLPSGGAQPRMAENVVGRRQFNVGIVKRDTASLTG